MIFESIDKKLEKIGWKKRFEGDDGFQFVKNPGRDAYFMAVFKKDKGISFHDAMVIVNDYDSIPVNENELILFAEKIKKWRRKYECSDQTREDSCKE